MTAGVQIDVTRALIGILWVMKSCLYDRWPRLWYRKIMWSLAMATKVKSGNHRAIMLLIDSSSIPRDRKQAELSIRALTPITPPLPLSHYIFNFTFSTFSVTLFVNSLRHLHMVLAAGFLLPHPHRLTTLTVRIPAAAPVPALLAVCAPQPACRRHGSAVSHSAAVRTRRLSWTMEA
jgi:hypothetical protein